MSTQSVLNYMLLLVVVQLMSISCATVKVAKAIDSAAEKCK